MENVEFEYWILNGEGGMEKQFFLITKFVILMSAG